MSIGGPDIVSEVRLPLGDCESSSVNAMRSVFLCRFATLPTSAIHELRCEKLWSLAEQIDLAERSLLAQRHAVSETIHELIPFVADHPARNRLLECRRDFFNLRRPRQAALNELLAATQSPALATVSSFITVLGDYQTQLAAFSESYRQAVTESRTCLRTTVQDERFKAALALSSETLSGRLHQFSTGEKDSSRSKHVQRGLLRYVTRMAMKATPFSQFCSIVSGQLRYTDDPTESTGLVVSGHLRSLRTQIRLNKKLYLQLWGRLRTNPRIQEQLRLFLNSTLEVREDSYKFLAARNGFEVFQRIKRTEVLEAVVRYVRGSGGQRLLETAEALSVSPDIEATVPEVVAFICSLVTHGLLHLESAVPEHEPDWDLPLASFLATIDDPEAQRAADLLKVARQFVTLLDDSPGGRVAAVREFTDTLQAALDVLGVVVARNAHMSLLEDAAAEASVELVAEPDVQRVLASLVDLIGLNLPYASAYREQAAMRAYFDKTRAASDGVSLLEFYESYYRDHFKEHLRRMGERHQAESSGEYDGRNPFGSARVDQFDRTAHQLRKLVVDAWRAAPVAEEIAISAKDLRAHLAHASGSGVPRTSVSVLCQLGRVRGRCVLSLPGATFHLGYGKYFSRFLHLFPHSLVEEIRSGNAASGAILAEIAGDGGHNANFHPWLVDSVIAYPLCERPSGVSVIEVSALEVRRHPTDENAVALYQVATGRRVIPLDLGFLNPQLRPPLFQLLRVFGPLGAFSFPLPREMSFGSSERERTISSPSPSEAKPVAAAVTYRPRVVYDNALVISRRCWFVPHALFPRLGAKEEPHAYFLRVNSWRRGLGIPDEVFAKIVVQRGARVAPREPEVASYAAPGLDSAPRSEPTAGDHQKDDVSESISADDTHPPIGDDLKRVGVVADKHSRDHGKPQYIDFRSPLLVDLFAHLPGALTTFELIFEERLLDDEGLSEHEQRRWVHELNLEVFI